VRAPRILLALCLRVSTKSHQNKYGYAAVQIGEPVLLEDLVEGPIWNVPKEQRRPIVDGLAGQLIARIGQVVPATPVPLFATAVLAEGDRTESAITRRVRDAIVALRAKGAPVLFGRAFPRPSESGSSIPALDRELDVHGEAELVVLLAGYSLERRGLVSHHEGLFTVLPKGEEILRYYANSIAHHLG
jgi:glycerol-3-phosphate O-acyltransferase